MSAHVDHVIVRSASDALWPEVLQGLRFPPGGETVYVWVVSPAHPLKFATPYIARSYIGRMPPELQKQCRVEEWRP